MYNVCTSRLGSLGNQLKKYVLLQILTYLTITLFVFTFDIYIRVGTSHNLLNCGNNNNVIKINISNITLCTIYNILHNFTMAIFGLYYHKLIKRSPQRYWFIRRYRSGSSKSDKYNSLKWAPLTEKQKIFYTYDAVLKIWTGS